MEQRRRKERNQNLDKIKQIQSYIKHDEDTIKRYRYQNSNNDYKNTQITKLKNNINENNKELELLKQKIIDIDNGKLDDDINNLYKNNKKNIEDKNNEHRRKKIEEKKEKDKQAKISKEYYSAECKYDRINTRYINSSYKYFTRICNNIPDYILKKLSNMPGNKGYIWRNIYCYGEKPVEHNQPTIMFETKNGTLIIHETSVTEYKIWHKKGKERKKLYYSEKRNKFK